MLPVTNAWIKIQRTCFINHDLLRSDNHDDMSWRGGDRADITIKHNHKSTNQYVLYKRNYLIKIKWFQLLKNNIFKNRESFQKLFAFFSYIFCHLLKLWTQRSTIVRKNIYCCCFSWLMWLITSWIVQLVFVFLFGHKIKISDENSHINLHCLCPQKDNQVNSLLKSSILSSRLSS